MDVKNYKKAQEAVYAQHLVLNMLAGMLTVVLAAKASLEQACFATTIFAFAYILGSRIHGVWLSNLKKHRDACLRAQTLTTTSSRSDSQAQRKPAFSLDFD